MMLNRWKLLAAIVASVLLAGCASADSDPGQLVVAIVSPADQSQVAIGDIVEVESLVEFAGGAEQAFLLVNGDAQRLDEFQELMSNGSLHQAWIPQSEGEYVLKVVLNGAGGSAESNEVTVIVGAREAVEVRASGELVTEQASGSPVATASATAALAGPTVTGFVSTVTGAVTATETPIGATVSPTFTVTASPTEPTEGAISGFVFRDEDGNGVFNGGDSALTGVTLKLAGSACPASGLTTSTTNGSGIYFFNGLTAGTYCVRVDQSTLPNIGGSWSASLPFELTVVVSEGLTNGGQDFAFEPIIN